MASRSRKGGGGGGKGGKVIWAFIIAALVFAFYQIPYNPGAKGIFEVAAAKSETVKVWAEGVGPGIGNFINNIIRGGGGEAPDIGGGTGGTDTPGTTPGTGDGTTDNGAGTVPNSVEATTALNALTVAAPTKSSYDRKDWKHWTNVRPCLDTRNQVLIEEAQPGSLVLHDKNGKVTTDTSKACKVISGVWVAPYLDETFTDPSKMDVDHTIPLSYANKHGAADWSKKKKEQFANDLSYPGHLIATSAKANRQKGDKGPGEWKPEKKSSWCAYAVDWITISTNYDLSISKADKAGLEEMLATCK